MLRIVVLSNIPTPYNDAFYAAVAREPGASLEVVYTAAREGNRSWRLATDKLYAYRVLPGVTLGGSVHVNSGVRDALLRPDPDIVVFTGSYALPSVQAGALLLRTRGVPWVYWGEELGHGPASALVRAGRRALRWPVLGARGVLAIGSRAAVSYVRAGVAPARIADFRYYADTRRFALDETERRLARATVRARLGLADDAVAVLYCGQLIPRKGVDTLVRALAALRGSAGPVVVLAAGDGPSRPALEELARELGVADRVRFLGFQQPAKLPAVFAAADAFVLPSHAEGWGVVVGEALAAGLPVLASARVNAAADLVVDGENGFCFLPGDASGLAVHLGAVAGDAAGRARMAERARAMMRTETVDAAARRVLTLLAAAAAGRPLAGCA